MSFKKSLEFFGKHIKFASDDKLFLCRADLLFRNQIITNIDAHTILIYPRSKVSGAAYLAYFVLALYSLLNILRLKFKNIKTAHYLIDIKNSDGLYDFRSKVILDIINPKDSVNFMHINNLKYTMTTLHKKTNVIYFEAIYYILKPFLKHKSFHYRVPDDIFANKILDMHQYYYNDSYHIYKIVKLALQFLRIDKFISLDDSRYSNELNVASKELSIKTIGYMHGRFNEYHLGLFEFPFDKYLVWSEYFKNKLLTISDKYKDKNIEVVGHFRVREKLPFVKRSRTILWLGESNINYDEVIPFIKSIVSRGYDVVFRGKPGMNDDLNLFLKKNNIRIDRANSYFDCLQLNNIGLVVGTHSTALMESWLVGVPSLILGSSYDYGRHLWEDSLIEICTDKNILDNIIEKQMALTEDKLIRLGKNIWNGNIYFDAEKVEQILMGNT